MTIRAAAAATAALAIPLATSAQSLNLSYTVTDIGGGLYRYEFECAPDAGWAPGMGWRWFIFGDCDGSITPCESPLADFVIDPETLPVGPWTSYIFTIGGPHNGPTFHPLLEHWIPLTGAETLMWSGTSASDIPQGGLLFSTPNERGAIGGAEPAIFRVARRSGADCYADCDGSGALDFFDFLCFQNAFASGSSYADCDESGGLDFFDFLCFQNGFALGCP